MGVRIIADDDGAVMYCSTTERAFGPVFHDNDGHDARERLELFLEWLVTDPRKLSDSALGEKYYRWLLYEDEQRKAKEEND